MNLGEKCRLVKAWGHRKFTMSIWGRLAKTFLNSWPSVSVKAADLLNGSYVALFCASVKRLIIPFRGLCELFRALNHIKIECDHD